MRLIGKLILLLIIMFLAWYLYTLSTGYHSAYNEENKEQEKTAYISHNAFQVANTEELTYDLPKNATNFKLLIYPIISKETFKERLTKRTSENAINFSLNIKHSGKSNKLDYKADVKEYVNRQTSESLQPFWFSDKQNVLLSKTHEFEVSQGKSIVFSLSSDTVNTYLVRTYYQQRQSTTRVRQRWQRSSTRRKENLLKYYPFDADAISNAEISSMYKNSWSSVAPVQDANSELKGVQLFEYENRDLLTPENTNQFSSLNVHLPKNSKYTFKVLDEVDVRLNIELLTEADALQATLRHKSDRANVTSRSVDSKDFNSIQLAPGQYELSFNQDVAFDVELNTNSDEEIQSLILPETYTSIYSIQEGESINYAVKSLESISAYYKAVFYTLGELKNAKVKVNIYSNEVLLSSGTESISFESSDYMPLVVDSEVGLQRISAAFEKNIDINKQATRIEIIAVENPVNVRLLNTVSGISAIKKVSKNSVASYQNSWFVLKPQNALMFLRDKKVSRFLNIESNAIKGERVAQSFEKLKPQESKRFKVVHYLNKSTVYSSNNGVNFKKLTANRNYQLKFRDKRTNSKVYIRPTLVVRTKQAGQLTQASINFAGKVIELQSTQVLDEYLLPKVEANKTYPLNIQSSDDNEYYINYTEVNSTMLSKRQLFKAKKVTKYNFYKRNNVFESLSINLMNNSPGAFEIKTTLLKNGKLLKPQQTSSSRKFIFDNYDSELSDNVLPSADCSTACYLYTPQFLPLYEDLKAGWYELHIETPSNTQLYIDVGKTYYQQGTQSIIFTDEVQN